MDQSHYSVGNDNTTPAAEGTINSVNDSLFFYNSAVSGPVNREFVLGSVGRSIGSMTFGSNAGTTQIDRDAASAGGGNNTALSVGAGGITVASGAGAVTFGTLVSDRNQRVTVRALADYTVANNSSSDLTFNREFDNGTNDTTRTVTVAGSGDGDTVFNQLRSYSNGRSLAMTISKTSGAGIVRFGVGDLNHDYTGATTVTAGTLLVDGTVTVSNFSVGANGILGGTGTIGGSVDFASGAKFFFDPASLNPASALTINGAVSFGGFGITNLVGLDSSVAEGTYTLINGTGAINFANVSDMGITNAQDIGGGKSAYFQQGSLQLVVIPEPSTLILLGISLATLAVFRRRK
jgi:autotransporter-associated beta strand protein